jgi:hypothetical protein
MATIVRYPRFGAAVRVVFAGPSRHVPCWFLMRDPETIETELMEISAIADDAVKLERIIAWCACHPDEVPFALHQLMNRRDRNAPPA